MTQKRKMFSGIQPTGDLHLGSLLGAVNTWVRDIETCDTVISIVDSHALTTVSDPGTFRAIRIRLAASLIAAGVNPDRCVFFMQSDVPAHAQLGWMMQCVASYGELSRMTQFKNKRGQAGTGFVSAGLFTYPALQAADILLYDTELVPVGEDQRQHIELCRDLAIRFNSRFGETFVIPKHVIPDVGGRVMDLVEPLNKMSKSVDGQGTVWVWDTDDVVRRKFRRATTDNLNRVSYDRVGQPGLANLIDILCACTDQTPVEVVDRFHRYGDLKDACADVVIEFLAPIRERGLELVEDPAELHRILRDGAVRATEKALPVFERVQAAVGLG